MSQYYRVTAYASVPQRHEVEVILPTTGPQGPAGPAGSGLETLTTLGDTLYRGASTGERLPIGTAGQILKVSAGGIPEWGAAPSSGVTSVTGTAPIVSSGGTTPAISISAATTSAAGSMSSADKAKLDAGSFTTLSASNDMEITDNTKGVVLKSPNNTRYRLTVSNSGLPIFTALLLLLLAQLAPAQNIGMATDTNGTILTDRTNTLTFTNSLTWATNVVAATRTNLGLGSLATNNSVPSGAATTNSLLTADGAGGSAFVASRTVTRFTTNDQTKTNWGFNFNTQATNNDPQMGSVALDANSFYRVEYAVAWVATTNSGFNHALGFSTNLSEFNHRTGVGQAANGTVTAITTGTNVALISLPGGTAAGTGARYAAAGFVYVLTSSNANTMTYRWWPISNVADATTLIRSSMVSVTKMAP